MLTSPWPRASTSFMHAWARLSTMARVLGTERRTDPLSPPSMSAFIVGLLCNWEIGEPHLVSPDVGTSARLAAANDADRFRSLVVGTGASAFRISYVGLSLPAVVAGVVAVRTGSLERRGLVGIDAGHQDQRACRPPYSYRQFGSFTLPGRPHRTVKATDVSQTGVRRWS